MWALKKVRRWVDYQFFAWPVSGQNYLAIQDKYRDTKTNYLVKILVRREKETWLGLQLFILILDIAEFSCHGKKPNWFNLKFRKSSQKAKLNWLLKSSKKSEKITSKLTLYYTINLSNDRLKKKFWKTLLYMHVVPH